MLVQYTESYTELPKKQSKNKMAFSGGSLGEKLSTQLGNDIATSKSARVIIPVCHIYLDHMMDLLLKKNLPPEDYQKIENDRHFGFWKKLQKLKGMKRLEKDKKYYPMLSDDEYHDLETINDVRNDFVHKFEPDLKSVTEKISSLKLSIVFDNPLKTYAEEALVLMQYLEEKLT